MAKARVKVEVKRAKRAKKTAGKAELSGEEVKHLPKAPANYEETARKFAAALDTTKFRGGLSGAKLRALVARGESIAAKAETLRTKAAEADRARIVAESNAWKKMLSTWRVVVAAMPENPGLERSFGFMKAYMAVGKKKTVKGK